MNKREAIIYIFIAAAVAIFTTGLTIYQINFDTLIIFSFIAIPTIISYYFSSRTTAEPTKTEKTLAFIWLLIRRFVSFLAAFLFLIFSIMIMFSPVPMLDKFWLVPLTICLSGLFIWVGVYGQGWERSQWKDDIALHKKNKERYKWRW